MDHRFLLSSKLDACNDYYARTEFPSRDPRIEARNHRGILSRQIEGRGGEGKGNWSRATLGGNARSRTQTNELTMIARAVFLLPPSALFLLRPFPDSHSPLSPPLPVAPLCFLNEQRTSDQLYRDLLFSERVVILRKRVVKQLSGTVVPLIGTTFSDRNFTKRLRSKRDQEDRENRKIDFS